MTTPNKNITYKRDKNGTEISGAPKDVRLLIIMDMISKELRWMFPAVILLIIFPKASLLPLLYNWAKSKLSFMTLFVVGAGWMLMLSG